MSDLNIAEFMTSEYPLKMQELCWSMYCTAMWRELSHFDIRLGYNYLCFKRACIAGDAILPYNLPAVWKGVYMSTFSRPNGHRERNFILNVLFRDEIGQSDPNCICDDTYMHEFCVQNELDEYPYTPDEGPEEPAESMVCPPYVLSHVRTMWDFTFDSIHSFRADVRAKGRRQRAFMRKLYSEGILEEFTYNDIFNDRLEDKYFDIQPHNLPLDWMAVWTYTFERSYGRRYRELIRQRLVQGKLDVCDPMSVLRGEFEEECREKW